MKNIKFEIKCWYIRTTENFWRWTGQILPAKTRYYATVKSCVLATMGEYENTVVPELSMMDMLKRVEVK